MAVPDKDIFSKKYPIDYFGEIWEKLSPLQFDKKTQFPEDVLCFLENGTVRKFIVSDNGGIETEISVDFYFEGDIFTAKAGDVGESRFVYQSIGKGML